MSFQYVLRYGGDNPKLTEILHIWFDFLGFAPPQGKENWQALGGTYTLETKEAVTRFQRQHDLPPTKKGVYGEVRAREWRELGRAVGFKAFDPTSFDCLWKGVCADAPATIKFVTSVGGYTGNDLSGGINIYAPNFIELYSEEFGGFNGGALYGLGAFLDFMRTDANLTDVRRVAYMMATVYHETGGTWQPVEEKNGSAKWYGKEVTVTCGGVKYTNRYYGRGFVQLTRTADNGKNGGLYYEVSQKMGMGCDLVANPALVQQPNIAYKILSNGLHNGWYIPNQKLLDYINGKTCDYYNARNVVNTAHDQATLIQGHAATLETIIRATMRWR